MEDQILIDVKFDMNDFAQKAASVQQGIAGLRKENKELKKDIEANTSTSAKSAKQLAENEKAIKEYNGTLKALKGQLQANAEGNTAYGDSLQEMRANLSQLKVEYAALSKAERESAKGKEMNEKLKSLNDEVKAVETGFGDFGRVVGNYPKQLDSMIPGLSKVNGVLGGLGGSITSLATTGSAGFKALGKSAVNMGKMFLVPPVGIIVLILSGILIVINKVSEAFKKNDDASTRLSKSFATFQPIVTALGWVFDKLAIAVSYVVEWLVKMLTVIIKLNPLFWIFKALFGGLAKDMTDAAQAARDLVQAIDDLEEAERQYTVNSAKRNAEIAKLRDKAIDKENETAEARLEALNKAIELERQNVEDEKKIADEHLRILIAKAKQDNDTSDESKNKIAEARAAAYKAEENYFKNTRRLQKEAISLRKEIADEEAAILKEQEDKYKEYVARRKEIMNAELAAVQKLQDEITKTISDSVDKQIAQVQLGAQREIEALKKRLKEEASLTVTARQAIEETIQLIVGNSEAEIQKIRDEHAAKTSEKTLKAEVDRISLLLDMSRQGSEAEYNLKLEQIELLRTQALAAEELTQQEIANINTKYNIQIAEAEKVMLAKRSEVQKQALLNDFKARRQAMEGDERALADLALEMAIMERDNLLALDEETKLALYENQEQYEAAVLASNDNVKNSTEQTFRVQQQMAENQAAIFGTVVSAIDTMFSEIAGDNAAFASFLKTLALAQASIELGLSIAAATRTASSGGDPYTVALRIISAVGGVVGSFVSVVSSIKKAKVPKAPKFEHGGIVPGSSFSGDNIIARVNSGEMILNANQQARLFDIANNRVSDAPIDYDQLAEITASAVSALPPPILNYAEFTEFTNNIIKYDEYANV